MLYPAELRGLGKKGTAYGLGKRMRWVGSRGTVTPNRPDGMAIRADQLTLGHLPKHEFAIAVPHQVAEGTGLLGSGQVVPMHRGRMKTLSAIGARLSILQARVPGPEFPLPFSVVCVASRPVRLVVGRCVLGFAPLAPRLESVPP